WSSLVVLGLTVGEAITGGLLPWDQRGWWSRVVEGNIAGLAPGLGGWAQAMLLGGSELGALGLARAHAAHVLALPLLFGLVLWARRRVTARHGWAPGGASVAQREVVVRSVAAGAAVVLALFAVTGATRAVPLDAPADPLSDYPARPEWYLLAMFALRKLFHGP